MNRPGIQHANGGASIRIVGRRIQNPDLSRFRICFAAVEGPGGINCEVYRTLNIAADRFITTPGRLVTKSLSRHARAGMNTSLSFFITGQGNLAFPLISPEEYENGYPFCI